MPLASLDSGFVIATLLSAAFMVVLSQSVTRIPLARVIQAQNTALLQASQTAIWVGLAYLAVSAGVFEEVDRYLGYGSSCGCGQDLEQSAGELFVPRATC